jgi:F0F1-type ATP synthase membrane subunit a
VRIAKIAIVTLVVLAILIGGRLFFGAPIAKIELGAETVINNVFGVWDVTNTILAAWLAIFTLGLVTFLASRNMTLIPTRRLQNLVEAIVEVTVGFAESVAGKERGRRFYPLAATIFLFVLISNWMGLLPFFGPLGRVEQGHHFVEEKIEEVIEDNSTFKNVSDEEKHHFIELYLEGRLAQAGPQEAALEGQIHSELKANKNKLVLFNEWGGIPVVPVGYTKKEIRAIDWVLARQIEEQIENEISHGITPEQKELLKAKVQALDLDDSKRAELVGRVEALDGSPAASEAFLQDLKSELGLKGEKVAGVLVPYFRAVNSDLMNTVALTLIAMFMVELWGIRAHGFFAYGGRFINLGALRRGKVIDFFVSGLEAISEFARVISFSARLFGNVFAGEILIVVFLFLFPLLSGLFPYFFELLFGFIQAVIFAVLTLLFATLATEVHETVAGGHRHEIHGLET